MEELFSSAQSSSSQEVASVTDQQNSITEATEVITSPPPHIETNKTDVEFSNVYFVLG